MFNEGHDEARRRYGTSKQAEHWLEILDTSRLNDRMITLIREMEYFFFATASSDGRPNVNFKAGDVGFLRVMDYQTIVFPDFTGNGILHSVGDLQTNPYVGLLVIDFRSDRRIKIGGKATIVDGEALAPYFDLFQSYDFERVISIKVDYAIPNCSRGIARVRSSILQNAGV